jgi:excisionase family DNA binding protein
VRLLTPDELAEMLAIPRSQIYRLAREGDLPAVRLGRYVRFDEEEVREWLTVQRTVQSGRRR